MPVRARRRPTPSSSPPSRHFARRPDALRGRGRGLSLAGSTARQRLVDIAQVQPGQRAPIHAAAGRATWRCRSPRRAGHTCIGTASAAKHDLLAELGVDEAADYRSQKFEDVVEPVDDYDPIGGDVAERSLDVLRPDGIQISLPSAARRGGGRGGEGPRPQRRRHDGRARRRRPRGACRPGAQRVGLRVLVDETFPLARAADAHRLGEAGRTTGKIVLTL